jgi:hypothetical protein
MQASWCAVFITRPGIFVVPCRVPNLRDSSRHAVDLLADLSPACQKRNLDITSTAAMLKKRRGA